MKEKREGGWVRSIDWITVISNAFTHWPTPMGNNERDKELLRSTRLASRKGCPRTFHLKAKTAHQLPLFHLLSFHMIMVGESQDKYYFSKTWHNWAIVTISKYQPNMGQWATKQCKVNSWLFDHTNPGRDENRPSYFSSWPHDLSWPITNSKECRHIHVKGCVETWSVSTRTLCKWFCALQHLELECTALCSIPVAQAPTAGIQNLSPGP